MADRLGAPTVSGHLERAVKNLKREIEGDDSERDSNRRPGGSRAAPAEAGDARPRLDRDPRPRPAWCARLRPDKLARVGLTLARWGRSPAAGFISLAIRHPDETAIVDELGTLTFDEIHRRTNALAHGLADAGVKEGDGVAIMCRNHRFFIEATVAASKLGADALYLNTAFAGPQLTEVVKREKPVAIIYDEEFEELLEEAGKRRKRFVAWHDSDDTSDPTLDDLLAEHDSEDPVPPEREAQGRDPHERHHRHAEGRVARPAAVAGPGRRAVLEDPAEGASDDAHRRAAVPLLGLRPLHDGDAARLDRSCCGASSTRSRRWPRSRATAATRSWWCR